MSRFITVEGNIGSGKSTLLPKLAKAMGFTPILEPADTDPEFGRLLTELYENEGCVHARNNFQRYVTEQRFNMLKDLPEGDYIIERSLLSDLVFTHATMSNYEHTAEDAMLHMDCYKHLVSRLNEYPKMDLCVYLDVLPAVAKERIKKRGRESEQSLSLEYLEDIGSFHMAVLPQVCRKMGTRLASIQQFMAEDDWIEFTASMLLDLIADNN